MKLLVDLRTLGLQENIENISDLHPRRMVNRENVDIRTSGEQYTKIRNMSIISPS